MSETPHIRTKSDEAALEQGCYFDAEKAERAIAWMESTLAITLYAWQRFVLWLYFGWRTADGGYRFKRIHIFIPKKNGKTVLIAFLIAFKLFELKHAKLYSIAYCAQQAKVLMDELITTFKKSPIIAPLIRPRKGPILATSNDFRRVVQHLGRNNTYIALSDNVNANDGLIPDVVVIDEIHRMKNQQIEVIDNSTANLPDALKVIITTAGSGDREHRSWKKYDHTKKVLAGDNIDVGLLPIIYECADADTLKGDAIYDFDRLVACNPVLQEDPVKREHERQQMEIAKQERNDASWRRFRFNQWVAQDGEAYINGKEFDACEVEAIDAAQLAAGDCYVGLDKSGGVSDFTGITALFPMDDGRVFEKHWTFAIADRIAEMSKADDQEYDHYIETGELITIPADAIVDDWLYTWFREAFKSWRVAHFCADDTFASHILEVLTAEGFTVTKIAQNNNRLLTPVITDYADRIRQKRIVHAPNALYAWQLSCARVFTTAKDMKKIVKAGTNVRGQGGRGHIDNVDALLNALAALRNAEIRNAAYGSGPIVTYG